ncbi:MAG TPA: rRNA maturation RNase YbeY [Candidatus Solibacter sp.]|nr:rRNA maturation RNase YbeY [Candidatus Solibacter sp.]
MILNQQRSVRLARRPLENFLRHVKKELGVEHFEVTVCFVSDADIAGMNERFRKKKGPTDVLSFPAEQKQRIARNKRDRINAENTQISEGTEKTRKRASLRATEPYLGDIAIAPETARRYAKNNGRSLRAELRVLILHGVLHLMGYDHETDRGEMNRIEQKMRRRLGLS